MGGEWLFLTFLANTGRDYVNKNFGPWGQAIYPGANNSLTWLFPSGLGISFPKVGLHSLAEHDIPKEGKRVF